jgi:hypothetical protein
MLEIKIDLSNDGWRCDDGSLDYAAIAGAVMGLARTIHSHAGYDETVGKTILDSNGNRCGYMSITDISEESN